MAKTKYSTPQGNVSVLQISYFTPDLPPPYSYQHVLNIHFKKDELDIDFKLEYIDRDDLEEEDIVAEGFSLADNFSYKGSLPFIWKEEILSQLGKTTYFKEIPVDYPIHLKIESEGEQKPFEGFPADLKNWEYFLQELVQGIFEAGKKESPLEVVYKEIDNKHVELELILKVSFLSRSATIIRNENNKLIEEKALPWKELKQILKAIYMPDYLPEKALGKIPTKVGKYINPGDGLWYEFGKALKNPDSSFNSLKRLEETLMDGRRPL